MSEREEVTTLFSREEVPDDLYEAYIERRKQAIRGLVFGKTPDEVVRTRPGRGQQTFTYVPVAWFIEQLNLVFKHQWDFEILAQEIVKDQIWVRGRLSVRGTGGSVISKTQYGGSAVKRLSSTKEILDLANDFKSAASDCLKKCASLYGFAWDVYSGAREGMTEAGPKLNQLMAFYKRADKAGMTKDAADEWFQTQSDINPEGHTVEEAMEAEVLGAIPKLIKLAKEKEVS